MRRLPHQDPGVPDLRSALAYLLWTARGQWRTLALGVVWAVTWFGAQAVVPAALGFGVQAASEGRQSDVLRAAAVLAVLGAVQAAAGILRHRMAVTNWIAAASRAQQQGAQRAQAPGACGPVPCGLGAAGGAQGLEQRHEGAVDVVDVVGIGVHGQKRLAMLRMSLVVSMRRAVPPSSTATKGARSRTLAPATSAPKTTPQRVCSSPSR